MREKEERKKVLKQIKTESNRQRKKERENEVRNQECGTSSFRDGWKNKVEKCKIKERKNMNEGIYRQKNRQESKKEGQKGKRINRRKNKEEQEDREHQKEKRK